MHSMNPASPLPTRPTCTPPSTSQPSDHTGGHRYIHVIGTSVFVDTELADDTWERHVVGIVEGARLVGRRRARRCRGSVVRLGARPVQLLRSGRAERVDGGRSSSADRRVGAHPPVLRPVRHADRAVEPASAGMKCPACGLIAYPRLAPAMIVLVTRGEPGPDQEALLARGVNFPMPMYSCLAGFVEPGEDLEGAVVREVAEEVGIRVTNVSYRASQPWPFPHSLMIGFRAEYAQRRPRARRDRDRRRQLVPPRRPADHPARHLGRPPPDRRMAPRDLRPANPAGDERAHQICGIRSSLGSRSV